MKNPRRSELAPAQAPQTLEMPAARAPRLIQPPFAHDLVVDEELARLSPPLAADELAGLEQSLLAEGCRDPLAVWAACWIILDGQNRYRLCTRHGIPFYVVLLELPDRQAAINWVIHNQLGKRNLTRQGLSYLRGTLYLREKGPQGGNHKNGSKGQNGPLNRAVRLGRLFKVGPRTIKRDGRVAAAVNTVAANCGDEAKRLILSRDARLTRDDAERLALLGAGDQQRLFQEVLHDGPDVLPWRKDDEPSKMISVPVDSLTFAKAVLRKLGPERALQSYRALGEVLKDELTTDNGPVNPEP